LAPAPDGCDDFVWISGLLIRADAIGGQQHDFSPPDVLLRRVAVLNQSFERRTSADEIESDFPARIAQTRTSNLPPEIPAGTQMSASIH
jgi:hypothetical protein